MDRHCVMLSAFCIFSEKQNKIHTVCPEANFLTEQKS